MLTISAAIDDPKLLGSGFEGTSWDVWRAVLRAAEGLPLVDEQLLLFTTVAERPPPTKRVRELVVIAGRYYPRDTRYIYVSYLRYPMPKLGPYSKKIVLARPDMRTKEGMPPAAKPAWVEPLYEVLDGLTGKIAAADVWRIVGKPASYRTQADNVGVGEAMRALGWDRTMQRFGMEPVSAYVRGVAAERRVPIYVFRDPITRDILIYRTARERLFGSTPIRVLRREHKRPFSV